MVDMHRRIFRPARHNRIDEPFERPLFLVRRHRPSPVIDLLTCLIFPGEAEEVFPSTQAHKWVTFEVKENVSGRRLWQQRETMFISDFKYLMNRLATLAAGYLHPRLFADL